MPSSPLLTDPEARSLLQAAGDTIEVHPAPVRLPPEQPPSRLAWVGAAAATVAVVVAASVAVTGGLGGSLPSFDPSPDPTERVVPPPWDTAQLGPDQVPSVFGYDAAAARRLLEQAGYDVNIRSEPACGQQDRAVRTKPAVGTQLGEGEVVTLVVTGPADFACTGPSDARLWKFIDFASGRSGAPDFATNVTLSVNGDSVQVSARQAHDLALWPRCSTDLSTCPGNALDVVAAAAQRVQKLGTGYTEPTLQRDSTEQTDAFTIDFPVDGLAFYPRWQVTLDWRSTDRGTSEALAGVDLSWLEAPASATTSTSTVPPVTGVTEKQAAATLEKEGLPVREERVGGVPLGCWRDYYAVGQNPLPGTEVADGTPVVVTTRLLPCGADPHDPVGLGAAFLAWARGGGDPPAFADDVGLYVGNRRVATVPGSDLASDPAAWQVPATYPGAGGTVSALSTVARQDGSPAFALVPHQAETCPDSLGPPPRDTGGAWVQTIEPPEPASCALAMQVQLWVDADDKVSAVNLLLGTP